MRAIYVVGFLFFSSILSAAHPDQGPGPVEETTVAGKTRSTTGSPVELSDAKYTLLRFKSEASRLQLVAEAVKIRNVSGRAIRRLRLKFVINHLRFSEDVCRGSYVGNIAVDEFAPGETRDYINDRIKMTWFAEANDVALTVLVVGAEFTDGSLWAAPRTECCPLMSDCLSKQASLMTRNCSLTSDDYSFTLEVGDSKIVAYRLGVVSDTADSFDVRTGDWIELKDKQRVRGTRLVDAGKSLSSNMVFPRQAYVSTVAGKQITSQVGTAIFVAALQFADGRIWRQDLTRAGLFWDQ